MPALIRRIWDAIPDAWIPGLMVAEIFIGLAILLTYILFIR